MEHSKTRDERIAELLDKSGAEAVASIKGPSLGDLAQSEPKVEEKTEDTESEETENGGKKVRIPASRLKTLTSKVSELEAQLQARLANEERIATLERQLNNKEDDLPEWWKEAYGDTDVSRQGYKNQQRIMREEMQRTLAEQEAQRRTEEAQHEAAIASIEQSFDDQMDELEETVGRELTATQKSELLDIVGEYSPQEDGKYIAYMPVAKAYDIWQKSQRLDAGKQEIAHIAGITSSGSSSTSSSTARPEWGDWRKRFF